MPLDWNKSWGKKRLYGSLRNDSEAERGVWQDLCDIAFCVSPRFGYLEKYLDIPFTLEQISSEFRIDLDLLKNYVSKCLKEGRLRYDGSCLVISNTSRYQVVPLGTVESHFQKTLMAAREIEGNKRFVQKHKDKVILDSVSLEVEPILASDEYLDKKTGEIKKSVYDGNLTEAIREFKRIQKRNPTIDEVVKLKSVIQDKNTLPYWNELLSSNTDKPEKILAEMHRYLHRTKLSISSTASVLAGILKTHDSQTIAKAIFGANRGTNIGMLRKELEGK